MRRGSGSKKLAGVVSSVLVVAASLIAVAGIDATPAAAADSCPHSAEGGPGR